MPRRRVPNTYGAAHKRWETDELSPYEKLAAMIAFGQLLRAATYASGLRGAIGGFFSAEKGEQERDDELFICDVDFEYPTPLPPILKLEKELAELYKLF
jgi:hypothetical protein